MSLRKAIIRLAHAKPELRPKLLPLLAHPAQKTAMAPRTIKEGIELILGEMASAMGKYLVGKYPEALTKMSKNPFSAGAFAQGISGEIKNQENSSRPGDIGVEATWHPGRSKYPLLRVWAQFPNVKPFERELVIKLDESIAKVMVRLGPAFTRDLDTWIGNMGYSTK